MSADLHKIAGELHAYAREHPLDDLVERAQSLTPLPPEASREFEFNGSTFLVTLTQTISPWPAVPGLRSIYLLSVCKLDALPNENGALLPTPEEGAEIAEAFFPQGCAQVAPEEDLLKLSLKYIALL